MPINATIPNIINVTQNAGEHVIDINVAVVINDTIVANNNIGIVAIMIGSVNTNKSLMTGFRFFIVS